MDSHLYTQLPNQVWISDAKLRYNLNLYHINTDMFAPPTHVKGATKNQVNGDNRLRQINAVRPVIRVKQRHTSDAEGFQGWSGANWQNFDDAGLRDWLTTTGRTKGEQGALRAWPSTARCPCAHDTHNGVDSSVDLSDYLKHLNNLLTRTKSLSAGCGAVVHRKQMRDEPSMQRYQLSGSAPSTPVARKRFSQALYTCRGSQGASGWTMGSQQSAIPCRNYNRLHKHDSFSDLLSCTRQAKLDNQHHTYTSHSKAAARRSRFVPPATENNGHQEPNVLRTEISPPPQSSCTRITDKQIEATSSTESIDHEETRVTPPRHSTMQEYIKKYYTAPSKTPTGGGALPVIAEKDQRLVENIINYRHTSTREKEAIHKSRYLQLTATDIRRTTALLLKASLGRNITKNQPSQLYSDLAIKREPAIPAEVTLSQMMGSKAANCRTKASSSTKAAISTENVALATRCNPHNYH